jgi:phospholipid-binding lipoprotein MlaA
MYRLVLTAAACTALLSAPAQAQQTASAEPQAAQGPSGNVYDPWEPLNRRLYAIHDGLDRAILEPTAKAYRAVTPGWARAGVRNVLRNAGEPVTFANDVLQGEFSRAGSTFARFGINSTFGLLGTVDVADEMGIEHHDEDFGQTLGRWGVPAGPYVFVPLLGPTTLRDGFGRGVDTQFDPLTYSDFDDADEVRAGRAGLTALSVRTSLIDPIQDLRDTAIDPYTTIRTQYGYARRDAIANGHGHDESLPQFDEIPDSLRDPAEVQPQPNGTEETP